ncbi:DUF4123 domain-containing protein [Paraburkholderia fungorum]|uniref:DUF4123 domain-containing protein n=1 Tax=Paraburkholderia fungorum TaxID=134537 RepID=A0A420GHB5_9BURK|nr:DUF4123 domain-containing protein [Paraburkholderia fungorum]RKF44506.1 hypothetical protein BCY88_28720 [Paraburkholderia fungorum]
MIVNATDWIDPYPDDALEQLRNAFNKAPLGNGRYYALFDMGFLPSLRDELPPLSLGSTVVTLYEGMYEGENLMQISPCLMPLPEQPEQRDALCSALLQRTNGQPMFSLLRTTTYRLAELAAHLRRQLEARTEDGEAFLVRFADTRCLPVWTDVLTAAQRARFFAGIDGWWFFDRRGALVPVEALASVPGGEQSHDWVIADEKPYQVDASQLEPLKLAAKVDTLIFHIRQRPESFGQLTASPSQVHECVSAAMAGELPSPAAASRVALEALEAAGFLAEV